MLPGKGVMRAERGYNMDKKPTSTFKQYWDY